ncbi:bis(5'-nucleosyl)-tetraphosphatase (symmetrical) YqeK [Brucepastera parasyntrophica]|uniref:bis(5'-nucleosyl)-tetraphosphatase (symmetrical) YqeK n=1 Tax=Brucepastera parasyntrophica TaxID=2880008 RepID=UPI0021096A90|nr:bis(5'-nucleosyl)-tetraphosphatase (symmetrical) YqeK [Brucepastera parasyntrophica]ULQ60489.1 bis(5'-nucleosyl)-tetraphosphatase (symmetrical) YqeK [Brucepastera parasyntrophica]
MNLEQLQEVTEKVNLYILGMLPPFRYKHSVRVAVLARDLCARFAVEPAKGYLAGIAHDMCKTAQDEWLLNMAEKDGAKLTGIEKSKPALLHGRAAALLLAEDFQVTDPSVLNAVRYHTFGSPDIDDLGKIIYVADKIEPKRPDIDPVLRERMLSSDLDTMTIMVMEMTISYLAAKGKKVAKNTKLMLQHLQEGKNK